MPAPILAPILALFLACETSTPPAAPPAPAPAPAPPPAAEPDARAEEVHVMDAWVRAMPPGSPNSAAFMKLHHSGTVGTAVVAAVSDVSDKVELHTHSEVDGTMQMRQVPQFPLAPDQALELKPGAEHLMLIGLKGDLALGQVVKLTVRLDDGSELQVEAPVKEGPPTGSDHSGHMGH